MNDARRPAALITTLTAFTAALTLNNLQSAVVPLPTLKGATVSRAAGWAELKKDALIVIKDSAARQLPRPEMTKAGEKYRPAFKRGSVVRVHAQAQRQGKTFYYLHGTKDSPRAFGQQTLTMWVEQSFIEIFKDPAKWSEKKHAADFSKAWQKLMARALKGKVYYKDSFFVKLPAMGQFKKGRWYAAAVFNTPNFNTWAEPEYKSRYRVILVQKKGKKLFIEGDYPYTMNNGGTFLALARLDKKSRLYADNSGFFKRQATPFQGQFIDINSDGILEAYTVEQPHDTGYQRGLWIYSPGKGFKAVLFDDHSNSEMFLHKDMVITRPGLMAREAGGAGIKPSAFRLKQGRKSVLVSLPYNRVPAEIIRALPAK